MRWRRVAVKAMADLLFQNTSRVKTRRSRQPVDLLSFQCLQLPESAILVAAVLMSFNSHHSRSEACEPWSGRRPRDVFVSR